MTKTEFINRVLLIMNEAGMTDIDGTSFLGANNASVDRYIEGSYENGWRMLAGAVPKAWLTNRSFKDNPIFPDKPDGSGFIVLPIDFYLLAKLKMKGWQKPIQEAAINDERVSSVQKNKWTRGSVIRPAGVIDAVVLDDELAQDVTITNIVNGDVLNGVITSNGQNLFILKALKKILVNTMVYPSSSIWKGAYIAEDTIAAQGDTYLYNNEIWFNTISNNTNPPSAIDGWSKIETSKYNDGSIFKFGVPITKYVQVANYAVTDFVLNQIVQVLEYYSLPPGLDKHEIEEAIYVPNVQPLIELNPNDTIDINQRIIEPLSYVVAGCVFTIFQKDQLAASLTEKGLLMIPGYRSVKNNNVTFKQ
jgi:hypothetical protein